MVTKRDLGIGYLLGTGMGLIVSLCAYLVLTGLPLLQSGVAVAAAAVLSGSLVYVGYWLDGNDLGGDVIWRIAQYSSLGLAVPVFLGVALTFVGSSRGLEYLFPSLFINTIASGAVIGLLLGTVRELRREHLTAIEMNHRYSVLNRVLRHNLRNDMSVILGSVDLLWADPEAERAQEAYERIHDRVEDLIALSESARRIERIDGGGGVVDIVDVVAERADLYGRTNEAVTFDLEIPERAWVETGPLCTTIVDNLIENAIEHGGEAPTIGIAVGETRGGDAVELVVEDDGPGIPEQEIEALEGPTGSQLRHGSGLGLWVVKWVAESVGGRVRFESIDPGRTAVAVSLPAATGDLDPGAT